MPVDISITTTAYHQACKYTFSYYTSCRSFLFHRYIRPSRLILGRGRPSSFISACSDDVLLRHRATGVYNLSGPCLHHALGSLAARSPPDLGFFTI